MTDILFKLLVFTAIIFTFLLTGACCTDTMCLGADNLDMIQFHNFSIAELDTIVIKRFSENSELATPIDSTVVITSDFSSQSSFQQLYLIDKMSTDFDYELRLSDSGQKYKISDFVTQKEGCNTGFMCNDNYIALKSFNLNGKVKESVRLTITK
ncbi:hypothetical protein [Dyadobacter psychrotolerans]|uniref:Lipoprotein n=1 Tax=Dyadobacter psychrotolerans TaxID=2541721 RepID=A0A4R5DLZ6_9BACT|nr:hypothetical protein [Dyadobacter psychrotolerans]TDE14477.1 hypothetical protein E0F88_14860 [Dyadobacter psychrotolerans]